MKSIIILVTLLLSSGIFAQDPPKKYQKLWSEILGGKPEAIQEIKKIALKETKDPWPYWMLGMVSSSAPENAIEYFKKSFEADPNFAPSHYKYGSLLDQTDPKLQPEIEEHYNKAIQLDSTSHVYYKARGYLYYCQKKYDQAIADSEKGKALDPEKAYFANRTIIECLHDQGKSDELKLFLKNNPDLGTLIVEDPDFDYLLATIYEGFGDESKACTRYKQAVRGQDSLRELFGDDDPDWYETAKKKSMDCK